MKKLLEHGSHYGHQRKKWNPKMKPNIYAMKNNVYIINLEKTVEGLDTAYEAMRAIAEKNGKILFVGTKKQAQQIVLDEALRSGSFYINQRWLGGTLTNFRTIQKRIKRLLDIQEMKASGTINVYPKKEIVMLNKEETRLENFLGGIKEMKKTPDAIFVVDPTEDLIAVKEARKLNVPVFAIIDTNADPEWADYPIYANDDAIRSIKLITSVMADAIVESKGGILSYAYQEEEGEADITMSDVIIAVDRINAENDRRRRQKAEERRSRPDTRYGSNSGSSDRKPFERRPREFKPYTPKPESNAVVVTEDAKVSEVVAEVKVEPKGDA